MPAFVEAIGSFGPGAPGAIEALRHELRSSTRQVRDAACRELAGWAPSGVEALEELATLLGRSDDGFVSLTPAEALGAFGPAAVSVLRDLSGPTDRRAAAAHALGIALGTSPEALPLLERWLADPEPAVRRAAANGLSKAHEPEASVAAALLAGALGDPDRDVRWTALIGLSQLGEAAAPALNPLLRMVRASESNLRWYALRALHGIDPSGALETKALEGLLEDPTPIPEPGGPATLGAWAAERLKALPRGGGE